MTGDDGIPASTPTTELGALTEAALRETDRRLATWAEPTGVDAVRAMLASIERQLRFMAEVVASGAPPTVEQANNSLTLGVIAAREFEADDPTYCDLLCEATFRFKGLATGPV